MNEVSPRHIVDGGVAVGIGLAWFGYLPYVAAGFGILWYMMQMYDWIKKKLNARKTLKRRDSDK